VKYSKSFLDLLQLVAYRNVIKFYITVNVSLILDKKDNKNRYSERTYAIREIMWQSLLYVPTLTRLGDRALPVAGPRLWNSLPSNLRQSDLTLQQFRRSLKTYLFCWLGHQHLVTF